MVTTLQGVFGRRGRRAGVVGKPRFQLGFDLNEILGLGLEVARMRPLEARLQHAFDPPIGIAEMIVDGRILGLKLDGALELFARPRHIMIVPDMPKTRSGKIMRRVLAAISNNEDAGDISTLANPEIVDDIRRMKS